MRLHILSATDSVRDRLSAYLYWNDFSGLAQGVAVARRNEVDLNLIRDWLLRENAEDKFIRFLAELGRDESLWQQGPPP